MDGGIGLQFPGLLNRRILRRLDGKRLFHAAAEDRVAVLVLFDKGGHGSSLDLQCCRR